MSAELIVKIGANAEKFRKELDNLEKQSEASIKRTQKRVQLAAAGFAAATAGGIAAFTRFADFESSFSNVVTLLDQSSFKTKSLTQGIGDLKNGLIQLRADTGESFDNLNQGLFDLISAGVDAESSLKVLRTATDLAKAGATDTSTAVDGLTSALNAYNLESSDAQKVSEKFFTAQKFGKTNIEELSRSLGQVAPTAASLNVSLNEVLATVSAATTAGIKTSQAYTGVKAVFANILKPTKDAANEAAFLGIEFNAASLRAKGLAGFLDEVTQAANFDADSLGKLFGSVEALNVVTALAGNQSDEFASILEALGDESQTAATFQDALAAKTATAQEKINLLGAAFDAATVALGGFISPVILPFLEKTTEVVIDLTKGFQALGVIISSVGTIIAEAFSAALGQIERFVAQAKLQISDLAESLQETINVIPGLSVDFGGFIDELRNDALELAQSANSREDRALSFFNFTDEDSEEALERQAQFQDASNQLLADGLEQEKQLRLEAEQAALEEGITKDPARQTREEFEATLKEQEKRQKEIEKSKTAAEKLRESNRKKHEKQLEDAKEDRAKAEEKLDDAIVESSFKALRQIVGDNKAAQTVLFLAEKGITIAKILINAQQAASLAIATLPPPFGEAVAAQRLAQGKIQAATVAAVALPELIGTLAAQTGGIVPGGFGGGDRVLTALEPGELIVPKQLTPTFASLFQDLENGGGGGVSESRIIIGFEDEASRFITEKQREDRILGVSG